MKWLSYDQDWSLSTSDSEHDPNERETKYYKFQYVCGIQAQDDRIQLQDDRIQPQVGKIHLDFASKSHSKRDSDCERGDVVVFVGSCARVEKRRFFALCDLLAKSRWIFPT